MKLYKSKKIKKKIPSFDILKIVQIIEIKIWEYKFKIDKIHIRIQEFKNVII